MNQFENYANLEDKYGSDEDLMLGGAIEYDLIEIEGGDEHDQDNPASEAKTINQKEFLKFLDSL